MEPNPTAIRTYYQKRNNSELGGGAWHSRLRQWVHSVPQADHFAQSVQPPSTGTRQQRQGQDWCSCVFGAASPAHTEHYSLPIQSKKTNLRSLTERQTALHEATQVQQRHSITSHINKGRQAEAMAAVLVKRFVYPIRMMKRPFISRLPLAKR
ncbi:hypothetical protein EYF80_036500 [Liparis tanakae]|uniref:Uncharacterized protein n=1 Tax=Liparis tanakae TaxID=230148 RepID=A0A4Z2GIG0_9TELE|nr:hypothetical protein EYF80_036500 [Liparis tanakae]